jgi:predicted alpha/beta hydrolase
MHIQNHPIRCQDGTQISAKTYSKKSDPQSPNVRLGVLIFCPALAVPQKFYTQCAEFFAEAGFTVLSFDYRGVGESAGPENPRLGEWGSQDMEAVIQFAQALPGAPSIYLLGHSIGGQLIGLAPSAKRLKGIVLVGASFPYWRRYKGLRKITMGFMFALMMPLVCVFKKQFPSKLFGLGPTALPSSLMADWSKWISEDEYLLDPKFGFDPKGYQGLEQNILAYAFDDDDYVPTASFEKILDAFSSADIDKRDLITKNEPYGPVGHFDYFRKAGTAGLWQDTLNWLNTDNARSSTDQT